MGDLVTGAAQLLEPLRLALLVGGVLLGLVIGVIPGVGGIFGLVLIIPLTYSLDPVAAFALLLGMASVTTTSDTIPAVLIGVPGTVGAAATVIDGHELAKQGQADRAFGAAYSASLIGGVFGALFLALALPAMRPLVLFLNTGDLLAITIFGLTLVALVSGKSPLRGLMAALLGALLGLTGLDPTEGAERWTFGEVYLWDGVPVGVVFLGLFGLPELAALLGRGQIQANVTRSEPGGMRRGIRDTLRNWPLVIRSSGLGAMLGAIPGIGVVVIEWVAYGDAARRPKSEVPFGEGNIRGVIAPESANNAKEGGSLIPTLAFGIPGSASMSILLGAFMIHGIVPGPKMLEDNGPLLVSLILTIALANVLGALICLGATRQLARLALIPARSLVPVALIFVVLGAFQSSYDLRDYGFLLVFGALGIMMKAAGWSRPALALGFVLAPSLERYFSLTWQMSGWSFLTQPFALIVLALAATLVIRKTRGWAKTRCTRGFAEAGGIPDRVLVVGSIAACIGVLFATRHLPVAAGLFPGLLGAVGLMLSVLLAIGAFRTGALEYTSVGRSETGILALTATAAISVVIFGPVLGAAAFVAGCALIFREPAPLRALLMALVIAGIVYLVFERISSRPWPEPLLAIGSF